jgi:hypothetical protein
MANPRPRSAWLTACDTLVLARADALEEVDSDEEVTLLADAQCQARDVLIMTPAPDFEAVAVKLEVFRDEELHGLYKDAVDIYLNTIIADVCRLDREACHGRD